MVGSHDKTKRRHRPERNDARKRNVKKNERDCVGKLRKLVENENVPEKMNLPKKMGAMSGTRLWKESIQMNNLLSSA